MLSRALDWLGIPRVSPFTGKDITTTFRVFWWLQVVDDNPVYAKIDDDLKVREGRVVFVSVR